MDITRRDALWGAAAAAVVTVAITAPLAVKSARVKAALAGDRAMGLAQQLREGVQALVDEIRQDLGGQVVMGSYWALQQAADRLEALPGIEALPQPVLDRRTSGLCPSSWAGPNSAEGTVMTEDRKTETPSMAEVKGHDDLHQLLTKSAETGNEKAQSMLDEDFDWRNMSFVRCQGTKTAIQWPPVELTSQDKDLVRGAACVIGNHCALDLIGHIKSHSKNYGGGRLLDIAKEIVKRGEWGGLEIGFFSALGNFIAQGRVPISADFDAVLTGKSAVMAITHSPVDLRDQWDHLRLDLEALNREHEQLSDSEYTGRFDNIVQALGGIETAIQHAPANDWQTVMVKLHVAVGLAQDQVGTVDKYDHPFVELLRTVTRDVGRLANEGARP